MNGKNGESAEAMAEAGGAVCGDPGCEVCVPPSTRCETCGALIWGQPVPYCSTECAGAGAGAGADDGTGQRD